MSLDYDITAVKNGIHKRKRPNGELFFRTLVHVLAAIGIPRITEDTIDELGRRINRFQEIYGPLIVRCNKKGQWVPFTITRYRLREWIGLKTNADTMTNVQFDICFLEQERRYKEMLEKEAKCGNS